jgi:hypothetical protein
MWKYRQANLDMVWAITGRKGCGKSSFAIEVARFYLKKYFGQEYFSPERWIAYDNSEVMKMIYDLPEGAPLICDEAARFAMGEDWNKAENKEMKKLFAQMRTKHLVVLMCIPRFDWMDKKYREDMVTHWAWIPSRSNAFVFSPDDNPGERDVWHLKDFQYLGKVGFFTDTDKLLSKVVKHKCFWEFFKFPAVPSDIYDRYVEIRDKKAFSESGGSLSQREVAKFMLFNLFRGWEGFDAAVRGSRFGRPTFKILSDFVMRDPRGGRSFINDVSVKNWIDAVSEVVGDGKKVL